MKCSRSRSLCLWLLGWLVIGPMTAACGPLVEPGPRSERKPVGRYNDTVVRVWRHTPSVPYAEYHIRREDVPTDLMPVLEQALADGTARIEVINRHGEIDPLPDGSPLPCSGF